MDETLERATEAGSAGVENLRDVLGGLSDTAHRVGELVARIQSSAADFNAAGAAAAKAAGSLDGVLSSQNAIVTKIAGAAETLGTSLASANNEFRNSAKTIADTTRDMTAGVQNYSQQVSELHGRLDEHLAKAIGSLNSTISELVDGLDDFLEEIGKRPA
jgi:methyl-accepting chemotaxis protein